MDGSVWGRVSAAKKQLSAPRSLRTSSIKASGVTLKWSAPKGAKPAYYVVYRDGKSVGKTTKLTYTDKKVKAGRTYRYSVRSYDKRKHAGKLSASLRVKVPKPAATTPTTNPIPGVAPIAPPVAPAPFVPTPEPPVPIATLTHGDGRPPVLARRLRPERRRPRDLDGQAGHRARRLAGEHAGQLRGLGRRRPRTPTAT